MAKACIILAELAHIRALAAGYDPMALPSLAQFGVVQTVGAYVPSVAMPDLHCTFPNLRINVREGRMEDLPRRLLDGVHDVLLLPDDPDDPQIRSARLLREPLQLVLPADHPLAEKDAIDPEDLRGETILTMERGHRIYDQIARLCHEVGAIHASDYAGTTLDTLRLMVTTEMGMSLLPALYVRSDALRETLVVARPLIRGAPTRDLTMCWRASSSRAASYDHLADEIRKCLMPWESA